MTINSHVADEAFENTADDAFEPRQGTISDAEMRYYLRRARNLRAQAFHGVARGLVKGVGRLWAKARRAVDGVRHHSLWRAPGSGNCLNC